MPSQRLLLGRVSGRRDPGGRGVWGGGEHRHRGTFDGSNTVTRCVSQANPNIRAKTLQGGGGWGRGVRTEAKAVFMPAVLLPGVSHGLIPKFVGGAGSSQGDHLQDQALLSDQD